MSARRSPCIPPKSSGYASTRTTWTTVPRRMPWRARPKKPDCPRPIPCALTRRRWWMRLFGRRPSHRNNPRSFDGMGGDWIPIAALSLFILRRALPALRSRRMVAAASSTDAHTSWCLPSGPCDLARLATAARGRPLDRLTARGRAWRRARRRLHGRLGTGSRRIRNSSRTSDHTARHRRRPLGRDRRARDCGHSGLHHTRRLAAGSSRRRIDRRRGGRRLRVGRGAGWWQRCCRGALPSYGDRRLGITGATHWVGASGRAARRRGERARTGTGLVALPRCRDWGPRRRLTWRGVGGPRHHPRKRAHRVAASVTTEYALTLCDVAARDVAGVSLALMPGEVAGVVGPAGAGKSTLLAIAAGSIASDAGEARGYGIPVLSAAGRRLVGYAREHPGFPSAVTVKEALLYYARLHRTGGEIAIVQEALDLAGLGAAGGLRVSALGRADLHRLALAQAVLGQRRVLLLDETFSRLRAIARRDLPRPIAYIRSTRVPLLLPARGPLA